MADLEAPPLGSDTGSGLEFTGEPAGGGGAGPGSDLIDNTRNRTLILIKNNSASSRAVTIAKQRNSRPDDFPSEQWPTGTLSNITKTLTAGQLGVFFGIPNSYNDADGKLHISYDEIADVLIQAHEIITP